MQPATLQPKRIAQYELTENLAQLGKVRVYRATDPASQRSVVLKTAPNDPQDQEIAKIIARFQRQAQISAGLKHPGIVEVYEYGEDAGLAFLASEFVEGCTLKTRLRVPMADACSLMMQLLNALDYAHGKRVLHLNVTPTSLVLTSKGELKLLDFGGPDGGSPDSAYRSPEQVAGGTVDQRSDVFSAGVFFYELLAGTAPFPGPPEKLADQICREQEPPVSRANPSLPKTFESVCAKSLAKRAEERYASAKQFSDAIREAYASAIGTAPRELVSNETAVSAFLTSLRGEPRKSRSSSPQAKAEIKESPAKANSPWPVETIRTVERQLAAFIGPLARVVVKEAAAKATDLSTLYQLAAESLASAEDRASFLAKQPGGSRLDGQGDPVYNAAETATFPDVRARVLPPERAFPQPRSVGVQPNDPAPIISPPPVESPQPALSVGSVSSLNADPKPIPESQSETRGEGPKIKAASVQSDLDIVARLEDLLGKQPETLAGYLTENPPEVEQVIFAFISSVEALVRLYDEKGKTDGLAPQNIVFDRLGKATIHVTTTTTFQGTMLGGPLGSPRYAAPEMFADKIGTGESAAAAADLYSLGFMFYEILLGRKRFRTLFPSQRNDLDWLRWHADTKKKAPSLKSQLPDRPALLSELLESMVAKDATQRVKDPATVIARLKTVAQLASRTLVSKKPPDFPYISSDDVPGVPVEEKTETKSSGRPWAMIVLAIVLVLGLVGLAYLQKPEFFRNIIAPESQPPASSTQ